MTDKTTQLLSIMKYRVTKIEFDFETDGIPLAAGFQKDLIADTMITVWEAQDGDDLVEEITNATGWCVKSINYVHALSC